VSARVFLLLLVVLCLPSAGCSKLKSLGSKKANVEVTKATLSADALTAAREVGAAAATEKDEGKLAGKLLALLERMRIAVVSSDGKKLLVNGPLASPPKEVFFWEPMIAGLARATAKGDTKRMTTLAQGYFPRGNADALADVDFPSMFSELGKQVAADKSTTNDAILITAIAEDLAKRGDKNPDPRIDPIGGALFGLWMSTAFAGPKPAPVAPSPPVKNDLARAVRSQAAGAGCDFFNGLKDKLGQGGGLFGSLGNIFPDASVRWHPRSTPS
jgi:hypothetical protein